MKHKLREWQIEFYDSEWNSKGHIMINEIVSHIEFSDSQFMMILKRKDHIEMFTWDIYGEDLEYVNTLKTGPYLKIPFNAKKTVDGAGPRTRYSATGMQGWRVSMEDAYMAEPDL